MAEAVWEIRAGPADRFQQIYGWVRKKFCFHSVKELETATGLVAVGLHLRGHIGHVEFFNFKENSQNLAISVHISSHIGSLYYRSL